VSFDPTVGAAGGPNPTPHALIGNGFLTSVSCPSATQCTAVDSFAREVTFDPATGTGSTRSIGAGGQPLRDVACPSVGQCTAVDQGGKELTFDPRADNPNPTPVTVAAAAIAAVACPSTTQCSVIDQDGVAQVFDPSTGTAVAAPLTVDPGIPFGLPVSDLACPTATQCTAVDEAEREVTFDPTASTVTGVPHAIGGGLSIACPSATQCTAGDRGGGEVTFDPTSSAPSTARTLIPGANSATVACPTVSECVVVDYAGNGFLGAVPSPPSPPAAGPPPPTPPPVVPAPANGSGKPSIGTVKVKGTTASVSLACQGLTGQTCPVTLTLTVTEKLRGNHIVAIGAAAKKKLKTKKVIVGRASAKLSASGRTTVKVALNATGKRLLKKYRKLTTTLRVTQGGKTVSTKKITFRAPAKRKKGAKPRATYDALVSTLATVR
jgi:hypothetical protein